MSKLNKPQATARPAREPFLYVTRRDQIPLGRAILIRVIAILLALIVCSVVTRVLTGDDPLSIYATILHGAFGTGRMLVTLHDIAILLCISLAVTPAFRMRFWNTGAEGQVLIGCLSTAVCMLVLGGKVPDGLLILIMAVSAILSGVIWGIIPAFFKAHWNTNETLFTLMMNYVAIQLVEYFLKVADKTGSNVVGPDLLTHGWFPEIFGVKYLLNILIVAIVCIAMHIYLRYSKHGYEIAVIGDSINTARYAGMNVGHVMMRTMFLSGAISGLVGFIVASGANTTLYDGVAAGVGFTSITVAWLSQLNAFAMIVISMMLAIISKGAETLQTRLAVPASISDIITGILLFCMLGCEFFINYRLIFRSSKTEKEAAKE